jgi:putative restriction endonuclease
VAKRAFGAVPGLPEGAGFDSRSELAAAGVHRPLQAGIAGSATEGADSIVVSGGYEDDEDQGDVLIYTGHGGNDPATGKQVAEQTLTRQNLALAVSCDRGFPVRVVRGAGGDPGFSPAHGYRYDGQYYVESYWRARGKAGFDIMRFRLVKSPQPNPGTNPEPSPPPHGNEQREYATVQRLVRNTAVTQYVKVLHDYTCQVCGERLQTPAGPYAEGAHLRPVGRPHNGPDAPENVLCLCPNDHVRLDRGVITLDGSFNVIAGSTGNVLGPLRVASGHELDPTHAEYHRGLHGGTRSPT